MHVLMVSGVFPPEPVVSSQTSVQIAEKMAGQGHQVKVLAPFPSRPMGQMYPQYKRSLLQSEACPQGYKVIRCFSIFSSVSSLLSRFLENISFGLSAFFVVLFSPRADIVYGNTWPIFAQGLTCLAARLRGIPVVLSVQDVYPESLSAQGRLSETHPLYKILKWIDRRIARSCRALIVISDRFAEIYRNDRGVPAQQVHVIPNWVDPQEISLLPQDQFRKRCGIPREAFVYVYGGNIGVAAGVEVAIEAFSKVKNDRVYLLIAGDGTQRTACENLVAKSGVHNIIFHHPWPVEETSEVLAAADVLILPTLGEQSLASVPSKMLNYMLAGRPILAVAAHGSDIEKIMNEALCGWQVTPHNPEALIDILASLAEMPVAELTEKGENGRKYVLEHFSRDVCLPEAVRIILCAVQN